MSLQFIFGNSGSGKSGYLYEQILEQAAQEPDRNFLILVPEQFTMQTQRELVGRQKNHAIMNVDVLSFARLTYRVFDELGMQDVVVLEDTGKNLVLRKVAELKKKELKVLGSNMNKMGYVDQVKSLLTELTQYNISPEDLEGFLEKEKLGTALEMKMQDVLTMYRGFREYLEGKYITSEEVLSLLCEVAQESAMLRNSVIVFDEFTGFTPVQNRLLRKLMELADKMIVSVTMDIREDFYHSRGVHELFAMSKKTVEVLTRMAAELPMEIEDPVILKPGKDKRYKNAPDLFFMEQNLFRPMGRKWENKPENISITGLKNPREELNFAAREITRLIREKGYCYKDIALVTGDVPQYANYVPEIFEQYGIPYFIDQTRNILFHPFIEFVRATLEVVEQDFSYESVFRFLRTGLAGPIIIAAERKENVAGNEVPDEKKENRVLGEGTDNVSENPATEMVMENRELADSGAQTVEKMEEEVCLTEDDIDRLENYVLARGIRGRKRWCQAWTFVLGTSSTMDVAKEEFVRMNRVRESIWQAFEPLFEVFHGKEHTVAEQTYTLYRFISSLKIAEQLKERELAFEEAGNPARAKEYAQIYKIVMDLLDKVCALLGEEQISIREYGDILDAGFSAAKVGIIPPGNDRVTIGDIERTRLNHVKILFFVGVNDGVVPKSENHGSIISQFERESITAHHLELAPGAREKVFIQKFYLYLNMTKPSDALYVTFSAVGSDGKAKRRSYLIGTLQKMFPGLMVQEIDELRSREDVMTPENAMRFFLEGLQKKDEQAAKEKNNQAAKEQWKVLANWYLSQEEYAKRIERLLDAAFFHHTEEPIGRAVTKALYGNILENSVTRLERFAACAFSHYLRYGLQLQERELQHFASVDMGNI
ncbi:MAG: PD-(D/E)XK nuclease family protein, partial [Roseburia sp.]|nr:PD-(D/E)XK nuclease family protein [Roseburia sp.]